MKVLDLMVIARAKFPQKNKQIHCTWIQKHTLYLWSSISHMNTKKGALNLSHKKTILNISMKTLIHTIKEILKLNKARRNHIYIYNGIIVWPYHTLRAPHALYGSIDTFLWTHDWHCSFGLCFHYVKGPGSTHQSCEWSESAGHLPTKAGLAWAKAIKLIIRWMCTSNFLKAPKPKVQPRPLEFLRI